MNANGYLIKSKGFHFTPRSREELPEGFPRDQHVTNTYLIKSKGFHFTPRSREELPEGFPSDVPGICHFLEKYDVQPGDDVIEDLQEPNLYMRSETNRRTTEVTIQVGAESRS
ncbi:uncharacterized protein LOC144917789 [Branchiostoma floridae x Branchiostoma belcheri]